MTRESSSIGALVGSIRVRQLTTKEGSNLPVVFESIHEGLQSYRGNLRQAQVAPQRCLRNTRGAGNLSHQP